MGKEKGIPKLSKKELDLDNQEGWTELDLSDKRHGELLSEVKAIADSVKEERATIRFNRQDLELLKVKAQRRGLGYQTLIGSIIHMYVTGQLIEIEEARRALKSLRKKKA